MPEPPAFMDMPGLDMSDFTEYEDSPGPAWMDTPGEPVPPQVPRAAREERAPVKREPRGDAPARRADPAPGFPRADGGPNRRAEEEAQRFWDAFLASEGKAGGRGADRLPLERLRRLRGGQRQEGRLVLLADDMALMHLFTPLRGEIGRRLAAFAGQPMTIEVRMSERLRQEKCHAPDTDPRLRDCRDILRVDFDKG